MEVLCEAHHRQRHEGWLVIGGEAPEFSFRTRAGVEVGEVFSRENTFGSSDDFSEGSAPATLGREVLLQPQSLVRDCGSGYISPDVSRIAA